MSLQDFLSHLGQEFTPVTQAWMSALATIKVDSVMTATWKGGYL